MLTVRKKKTIIEEHQTHKTDTGSAAVQVGLLTRQIEELGTHLKKHPKDHHSRRGILKMVGNRRTLLAYLKRRDEKGYLKIIKKLDLKK